MNDFEAVHARLREILLKHRGDLAVTKDGQAGVAIEIPGLEGKPWGYVAGTRVGKRYVSFYLMPVYASPALLTSISPSLRKRMQGKACFNFSTIDEGLFEELADLTRRGVEAHRALILTHGPEAGRAAHQRSR